MIDALGLKIAASFWPLLKGPVHRKTGTPALLKTFGASHSVWIELVAAE